jgi:hypothetical protein
MLFESLQFQDRPLLPEGPQMVHANDFRRFRPIAVGAGRLASC